MHREQRVKGRVIMVQESRFRIVTSSGQAFLFGLSHAAGVDETDLLEFYRRNIPVIVDYRGEPGLETGTAHSIVGTSGE